MTPDAKRHRLIRGDSFCLDWHDTLAGRKISLLMIDPPYNMTALRYDGGFDLGGLCKILHGHLAPNAWIFLWGPLECAAELMYTYRRKFEYIWHKLRAAHAASTVVRPYQAHEILWAFVRRDLKNMSDLYFDREALRTPGEPYIERRNDAPTSEYARDSGMVPRRRHYETRNWGYREGTTVMPAAQKGMMRKSETCGHPTLKPLHILEPVLRAHCPPDGLVVDPCAGAASTLLAAVNTGRDCIAVEKDEKYMAMATKRLRNVPPPVHLLRAPNQTTLEPTP